MALWFRVGFEQALTHCVSQHLIAPLIFDMAARGCHVENFEKKFGIEHARALEGNPKAITEWGFDLGGFYIQGEPEIDVMIDGLKISIPCSMYEDVLGRVQEAKLRRFDSGEAYFKLKFWIHATVLTVDQYVALLREMQSLKRLEARDRADAFREAMNRGFKTGLS